MTQGALVTAAQATPLATVQQTDPVYVDLTQSATELLQLRKELAAGTLTQSHNVPVMILLEDGTPYEYPGKLAFSEISVDPSTGSFGLRVTVKNPDHILMPGMYVRASIGSGERSKGLLVPQQGIAHRPRNNADPATRDAPSLFTWFRSAAEAAPDRRRRGARKLKQCHHLSSLDGSNIAAAVSKVASASPQAILVVSAGKPSVDFVDAYMKAGHRSSFYMLSIIGSEQLRALGDRSRGVVVSQVFPAPWKQASRVAREFRALADAQGLKGYTFGHMEGFLSAKVLVEALRRSGKTLSRESLIRALESMTNLDMGGFVVDLSEKNHNSERFVDLMIMGQDGRFQ